MPPETPAPDTTLAGIDPKNPLGSFLSTSSGLISDLRKAEEEAKNFRAEATGYYKDAADEVNRIMAGREQEMGALQSRGDAMEGRAKGLPAAPQAPPEPDVPSREAKPFLNLGENAGLVQSLNTTLYGLGLLAQMGMGIAKGFPNGALAAYSGALQGWSVGDHVRAENMWKEYLAQVGKMSREYQRQRQEYQDILDRFGLDQSMLQTQMGLAAAKNGLARERIELAMRKPEEFMRVHQLFDGQIARVREQAQSITTEVAKAFMLKQQHDIVNSQRERMMNIRERQMERDSAQAHQFSPAALEAEAKAYADSGEPPKGLGMGKAATAARIAIANRAAEIRAERGDAAGSLALKRANYAAAKAELTNLQKQRGSVEAFARSVDKALTQAEVLSNKVARSGSPVLNAWINAGRNRGTGDPMIADFNTATELVVDDSARIITTVTGGGVTSDAARAQVRSLLNSAQTPEQFSRVVARLRLDIQNRKQGYEDQIKYIHDTIVSGGPPGVGGSKESVIGAEIDKELGLD